MLYWQYMARSWIKAKLSSSSKEKVKGNIFYNIIFLGPNLFWFLDSQKDLH